MKKANSAFFEMSGLRFKKKDRQHPFLVLKLEDNQINVEVVENTEDILRLPAKTTVMKQWPGKTRSDYYQFTISELKRHLKDNPKKHSFQVI